jgi:hypothetical protein
MMLNNFAVSVAIERQSNLTVDKSSMTRDTIKAIVLSARKTYFSHASTTVR